MKLPEEFRQKMQRLMDPEEYETFMRELKRKVMIQSLRVNTKKITVAEFLRIFPHELTPVPWCAEVITSPRDLKLPCTLIITRASIISGPQRDAAGCCLNTTAGNGSWIFARLRAERQPVEPPRLTRVSWC